MNTVRHIRTIIIMLALIMGAASETWALSTTDIVIDGGITNGSVAVTSVDDATRVVTITVTPASGYFVEKSNIIVQKLVDPSISEARRRVPAIADALPVSGDATTTYPNAGTYTFTVPEGYAGALVSVTFTGMNPATATVTPNELTYTGVAQALVTLGTVVGGAETDPVTYSLTGVAGSYSATIPTGTDAGSYTVYYKVAGDATHAEGSGSVTVTIQKAVLSEVTLAQSVQTYTGSLLTFTVSSVKAGAVVVPEGNYTVSGNTQTAPGNYTLTVTAVEDATHKNFTGSATASYRIVEAAYKIIHSNTPASEVTNLAGTYVLAADVSAGVFANLSSGTFTGTLDGNYHKITGLTVPLFTSTNNAIIHNLFIEKPSISTSDNAGAITKVANGSTRIYNCGILPDTNGNNGSVSGSGYTGGLVGWLKDFSRVINCFSYAAVTGGSVKGGIVGYNDYASKSGDIKTMVMNCMFYGTGSGIYPIYGGEEISNEENYKLNNYNYFSYEKLPSANIAEYNRALAAEDRYLKRWEYYRYLLNSTRELAAWYVTGFTSNAHTIIAKWVYDKSIAEYPILKPQDDNTSGTYPSVVNYDPEYTNDATGAKVLRSSISDAEENRNKGRKLGTLTVNISVGTGAPSGAAIKTGKSQITLNRTDKDYNNYNFNYDKVQLPYYNQVGTGNCTKNKVVTGWKITGMTGGTVGSFTASDTWGGYNFADRSTYAKDIYATSGRVFSQGAYFDVPDNVTAIDIEPYWGTAAYLSDAYYDTYGYSTSSNTTGVTDFGTRYTNNTNYTICGDVQKVYTSFTTALSQLSGATVYDNAIVLVGNYHQGGAPSSGDIPFTIMSADLNNDNEPDYCFIYNSGKQEKISPIRFDFVAVPGTAMAHKLMSTTYMGIMGNHKWKGWLETTNTSLVRFSQLEYDDAGTKSSTNPSPVILLGGIVEQIVSTNGNDNVTLAGTTYIHVGSNVWFKLFNNGCHIDKTKLKTPHIPISVTGGEYEKFYLSGYFKPDAPYQADDAECYVSGGKFGEVAGAGQEKIDGNVQWLIDRADMESFFGGGINAQKPISGDITVTVKNSHIGIYAGGPKFGNMQATKVVTTTATDCTFNTFFGAGYGGTSLYRYTPADLSHNQYKQLDYPWNTWASDDNGYTRGKYEDGKGIAVGFEYEHFEGSNDKTVGRLYVNYATLSPAQTNNVTSTLTRCTLNNNFYGGGNVGSVNGNATSTLTDCIVKGNAFGAGYKSSANPVSVFTTNSFVKQPTYNTSTGIFEAGVYPATEEYIWSSKGSLTNNSATGSLTVDSEGKWIHTDVDLTTLGTVNGNVTLTITGDSKIGTSGTDHNVFGGGDASAVSGNTTVNLQGNTEVLGDVYGGGNEGAVEGNTEVNIQD